MRTIVVVPTFTKIQNPFNKTEDVQQMTLANYEDYGFEPFLLFSENQKFPGAGPGERGYFIPVKIAYEKTTEQVNPKQPSTSQPYKIYLLEPDDDEKAF